MIGSSSLADDDSTDFDHSVTSPTLFFQHTSGACTVTEQIVIRLSTNPDKTLVCARFFLNTKPHEVRSIFGKSFYEIIDKTLCAPNLLYRLLKTYPNSFTGDNTATHIEMLNQIFFKIPKLYFESTPEISDALRNSSIIINNEIKYLESQKQTQRSSCLQDETLKRTRLS